MYNPFLSDQECADIVTSVIIVMLCANRISQINLAMHQINAVKKSLALLKACLTENPNDHATRSIICKELLSSSTNLAATLAAKRHFVTNRDGAFEVDPRFLVFEFCHNILLRKSQIELVRKLMGEMVHGRSVCHQVCQPPLFVVALIVKFR